MFPRPWRPRQRSLGSGFRLTGAPYTPSMPSTRHAARMVEVDMTLARVHEIDCRWVQGAVAKHPDLEASYKTMPAGQVPAGKKHCSRC